MAFYITPSYSIFQYLFKIRNLNSDLTESIKLVQAWYATKETTTTTFTGATEYIITFDTPDGYVPVWAWCYSYGFISCVYCVKLQQSKVNAWVAQEGDGKTGNLVAMVLCVKESMLG